MNTETLERAPVKAKKTAQAQALAIVTNQIAQFGKLEAGFLELEARYKDVVYVVSTTAGMTEAKKARQEIRAVRINAQTLLVETKRPLNDLKAEITEFADKIIERIRLTETPIDEQIKAEEARKEAEKAERDRLAKEKADLIESHFSEIRLYLVQAFGAKSSAIAHLIANLEASPITLELFLDRTGEAEMLKDETLEQLRQSQAAAQAHEEGEARRIAEQEAERESLANERRQLNEERAAIQAQLEAGRLALAAQQAEANARQAKLDADQKAIDAAKALEAQRELNRKEDEARAAQKVIDDAKAAAEAVAYFEREAKELAARQAAQALEVAKQRIRDAAPAMLDALMVAQVLLSSVDFVATEGDTDAPLAQIAAAITQAIGETA